MASGTTTVPSWPKPASSSPGPQQRRRGRRGRRRRHHRGGRGDGRRRRVVRRAVRPAAASAEHEQAQQTRDERRQRAPSCRSPTHERTRSVGHACAARGAEPCGSVGSRRNDARMPIRTERRSKTGPVSRPMTPLTLARLSDVVEIAFMSRDLIEQGLRWSWTPREGRGQRSTSDASRRRRACREADRRLRDHAVRRRRCALGSPGRAPRPPNAGSRATAAGVASRSRRSSPGSPRSSWRSASRTAGRRRSTSGSGTGSSGALAHYYQGCESAIRMGRELGVTDQPPPRRPRGSWPPFVRAPVNDRAMSSSPSRCGASRAAREERNGRCSKTNVGGSRGPRRASVKAWRGAGGARRRPRLVGSKRRRPRSGGPRLSDGARAALRSDGLRPGARPRRAGVVVEGPRARARQQCGDLATLARRRHARSRCIKG